MSRTKKEKSPELEVFSKRLSELVKEKMDASNGTLKQGDIAKECGVSPPALSKWMRGTEFTAFPDIDYVYKIAKYFNVSIDWLVGIGENKHPMPEDIISRTGLTDEAINNLIDLNAFYKIIYNKQFDNEDYFDNLPSKVIASTYFKNLIFEFYKLLHKYRFVTTKLSELQNTEKVSPSVIILPDDIDGLRYGKYSLGDYCYGILNGITNIEGNKSFDEVLKDAEKNLGHFWIVNRKKTENEKK